MQIKMSWIVSLVFILLCTNLNAQKIKFTGNMETGYESRVWLAKMVPEIPITALKSSLFNTIDVTARWKGIALYTSTKTYFKPDNLVSYTPLQVEFLIGAGVYVKKTFIKYEHFCSHSVDKFFFNDAYDRISIKFVLFK